MTETIVAVRGQPDFGITLAHGELKRLGESICSNPRYDATEIKEIMVIDGENVGFVNAGDKPDL